MGYRLSGISFPFGGIQWERTTTDSETVRNVFAYLADWRVLFRAIYAESEPHCVESANRIRAYLTEQLTQASPSKDLSDAMAMMRAACRRFVDAADADGHFRQHAGQHTDPFSLALGELRSTMTIYVAALARAFNLELPQELREAVPPQPADGDDRPESLGLDYY